MLRETEEREKKEARWVLTEKGKGKKRGLLFPFSIGPSVPIFYFCFYRTAQQKLPAEEGQREALHGYALNYVPVSLCVPTFGKSAAMSLIFQFVRETVYENQRS